MLRIPAWRGARRQVLLGRKKRGFGAGMIMGLGGKARPGEPEAACAVREVREEAGIAVDPDGLAWRAELSFVFPSRPELDAVVTVFFGERWSGEPQESEEMVPEWCDAGSLPLDHRRGGLITAPRPRKSRSSGKRRQGRQPGAPGAHLAGSVAHVDEAQPAPAAGPAAARAAGHGRNGPNRRGGDRTVPAPRPG